jgi:hypothetical protein
MREVLKLVRFNDFFKTNFEIFNMNKSFLFFVAN